MVAVPKRRRFTVAEYYQMADAGILTDDEDTAIQQRVAVEIQEAVRFAESSPYPTPDELYKDVYSYEYA